MSITVIISIIIGVLVLSVVGSIIFTKKEQAAAERRQKIASSRYKADEAQDLHDGLQKAGLDKLAYKFLLERVLANTRDAYEIDPNAPGIKIRMKDAESALKNLDSTTYYVEMPSAMAELHGLISRLNKLMKYLVLLYSRRSVPDSIYQQVMPSLQNTLLKFDAEGHIKMGHQAANEGQMGTAKQSYLHAKEKLTEFGTDDAYVQQQLEKVDELLAHLAQQEQEMNLAAEGQADVETEEVQEPPPPVGSDQEKIQDAVSKQAELNRQNQMDNDVTGSKKKW